MEENLECLFGKIIEENKQKILRICFAYTTNQEDQKDLFQEIALNIWKSLPSFRRESSTDTWVYRICLNISMQYARMNNKNKRSKVEIEGVILSDKSADIESNFEKAEKIKRLHGCISKLNTADKALVLLFLEDLSYQTIAEVTGISENYVAVKLSRIKTKLFNCINN